MSGTASPYQINTYIYFPDSVYTFPNHLVGFVPGVQQPEDLYAARYDIISRLASKLLILLSGYKHKPATSYNSFHKVYLDICSTLTNYPIFHFQKFNFIVNYCHGVPEDEQDCTRILRHLDILRENLGGDPHKYTQVYRIKIKSGFILWSSNSSLHKAIYVNKDLPDLVF